MTATLAPPRTAPAPPARPRRGRAEGLALAALLAGSAVLYLWDLAVSGWANDYYAAAVQSMTKNWTAFFFASFDAGNIVTVDKPPAALWVMALSARVFGFNSWSMLVPQALMGVATVALLHAAVRRVAGPAAGLVAGLAMALTPVAVVMFRFNNPDALLVLLLVAAAYATVRAIEKASTPWLLLAGALIGFAFLTKMAQAFVVVPALALAYLVAAPTGSWRRVRQLLAAGVAIVVAAGWWVAIAELWPTDSRPYIGGSQGNNVLELALGYNGLGRIFGNERGGVGLPGFGGSGGNGGLQALERFFSERGGFGGFSPFGDRPGLLRMFGESVGTQAAWLLPAALALLVAGLWLVRRAPRTDRLRASLLLWGAWTLVSMAVFSFAQGIFHPYYTVALAPGIAALVGIGGVQLWRVRTTWPGRIALAVVVGGTGIWAAVLLARTPDFLPWLRWVVLAVAVVAVLLLLVPSRWRVWTAATVLAVLLTGGLGPLAYAVQTATTPHTGGQPTAGPAGTGFFGAAASFGGRRADRGRSDTRFPGAGRADGGRTSPGRAGGFGGFGGFGTARGTDPALVEMLRSAGTKWAAATVGAQAAAPLALESGATVMAIGGFSGSDPAPTLEQFQDLVSAGQVHYFIEAAGPRRGGPGITEWVQQNFPSTNVGGLTVYDLTRPAP